VKNIFLPKTRLGKWSVLISIVFIILIWAKIQFGIPLLTFVIAAIGLVGFILSLIALIKNKDRTILILLPVLVGLIILIWTAAELISPH